MALIVKYPLDALSHQHYQLSLVITCCSVYTYLKHLKKVDRAERQKNAFLISFTKKYTKMCFY